MAIKYKVKTVATEYNPEHEPGYSPHAVTYDSLEGAEREFRRVNAQAFAWYQDGQTRGIPYYAAIEEVYVDDRTVDEILEELKQQLAWLQGDEKIDWVIYDRIADVRDLVDDLAERLKETNDGGGNR